MLDIRRLRMLHEFAARGSIARTAEALGYTPSAVSQQLAVLEKEAGTPLLDRTARSAGLTDAGKRLAGPPQPRPPRRGAGGGGATPSGSWRWWRRPRRTCRPTPPSPAAGWW